jgi:hypothetical protein
MANPKFNIKQNDTWPPLQATLQQAIDGVTSPIDLTGATVKFMMRPVAGGAATVNAAATIVGSAANGVVQYQWLATDTATVGDYVYEWQITFGDGKVATVPTLGQESLGVIDDIAD